MASRPKSFKFSADLEEIAEILAKENNYASGGAFVKGLIRYAAVTRAKHKVSHAWSLLSLREQDALEELILKRLKAGKGMTAAQAALWDWRVEAERS